MSPTQACATTPPFRQTCIFMIDKMVNHDQIRSRNLCSPNEDFGKRNRRSGVSFRVILRAFVAQIEYSHPRKVPRKDTPDLLFRFPKSSFGRHKMRSTFQNQHRRLGAIQLMCVVGFSSLCSPNLRFGRLNKALLVRGSVFQWFDYSFWATIDWNFMRPKRRCQKAEQWPCFQIPFHIREYSIWATNHWKGFENTVRNVGFAVQHLRLGAHKLVHKRTRYAFFSRLKSSFGEHKVLLHLRHTTISSGCVCGVPDHVKGA